MHRWKLTVLAAALVMQSCDEKPVLADKGAIDGAQIDEVLARVKREVGWFLYDSVQVKRAWPDLLSDLGPAAGVKLTPRCGDGYVQFNITSVNMEFSASTDTSNGGNLGFKIPFGPVAAGSKVGATLSQSVQNTLNQKITYLYKPPTLKDFEKVITQQTDFSDPAKFVQARQSAVILPMLNVLRDGIIKATQHFPCFHSLGQNDPDQKLTVSVGITKNVKAGGEVNFYLISAGANHDAKNNAANLITVSFRPINASLDAQMQQVR